VIGIVQVGAQAMADRYSYLPSLGLFIAVVWGLYDLMVLIGLSPLSRVGRFSIATAVVGAITLCALVARQQVWYWQNEETLFGHCYEVTGPNPVACFFLGVVAYGHGQRQSAIDNFTMVIEQDPGNDAALKFLADLLLSRDLNKSIACYAQAVTIKPDSVDYRIAFAFALTTKGDLASLHLAEDQLQQVLQLDPTNAQAHIGLADVHARIQKIRANTPGH
jgi:tetratricopeptide (TPR) repeat protein